MNDPLEHAREQLREEFEQLRGEIEELRTEESAADAPFISGGFGKVRASLAVLALSAAIATAAGNFALNGGRTTKDGSVSVPLPSGERDLLSLIGPGLQVGVLGSHAGLPSAGPPSSGPSPLFIVGDPVSESGHGSRGGDVAGGHPVSQSPNPTPPTPTPPTPAPEPEAPQLAFSPPPAPAGETGEGPGKGKVPSDGGKPGSGGNTATILEDDTGGEGEGPPAKGHIKAPGKGHGDSPGKGHEKDQEGGEVGEGGPDDKEKPGHDPGPPPPGPKVKPDKIKSPDHGESAAPGKSGGSPGHSPKPPPAAPVPPPPGPGPKVKPDKIKSPDTDHGKSATPGKSGK